MYVCVRVHVMLYSWKKEGRRMHGRERRRGRDRELCTRDGVSREPRSRSFHTLLDCSHWKCMATAAVALVNALAITRIHVVHILYTFLCVVYVYVRTRTVRKRKRTATLMLVRVSERTKEMNAIAEKRRRTPNASSVETVRSLCVCMLFRSSAHATHIVSSPKVFSRLSSCFASERDTNDSEWKSKRTRERERDRKFALRAADKPANIYGNEAFGFRVSFRRFVRRSYPRAKKWPQPPCAQFYTCLSLSFYLFTSLKL